MSARIVAEIGADVSGFETGLKRAEGAAEKFEHKLHHHFSKAFGVGLFAALAVEAPRKMVEMAEKISEGAAKLGVTTDEYQMLAAAAKDAGEEVGEFVKENAKQGVLMDSLVGKLEEYRNQVKMSQDQVKEWKEIGENSKSFLGGAMAPVAFLARKAYAAGAAGLNLGGAAIGAMGNGFGLNFLGINYEDYLLEARKQAGNFFGWGDYDTVGDSKKLPMPTEKRGLTPAMNALQTNLGILMAQEKKLKKDASTNYDLLGPSLSGREEAGAYVSRPSMIVSEQQQTNQKLDEVREEITHTKEEIQKIREGN